MWKTIINVLNRERKYRDAQTEATKKEKERERERTNELMYK